MSELLALAGSEGYKIVLSESTNTIRVSFNGSTKYNPTTEDNTFTFTAAQLLTAAGTSGDATGIYTWNPEKTAYVTLNGGTSTTAYSANILPLSAYTLVAQASLNS